MANLLDKLNQQAATIIHNGHQSLVSLDNGRRGQGAGTIWHADGLILTNAHVAQRRSPKVTLWNGRSYPSQLLAYDETKDLAALTIDATNLPTIAIADDHSLEPGTWVVALGHPWGVAGGASAGAVIDCGIPAELPRYRHELIQVGLQLRPGHSGGPLLDGNGRLVGINTMISGPQVGLAIPIHIIRAFLKEKIGSTVHTKAVSTYEPIMTL